MRNTNVGVSLLGLILAILISADAAGAQSAFADAALEEGSRLIEIGKALKAMPQSGKRVEDFVPPHWKVFTKTEGDLNRNGVNDAVAILQMDPNDKKYLTSIGRGGEADGWTNPPFMIIALLDKPNKNLEIEGVNYSIGALPLGERDEFTLEIKNGVVSIFSSSGGTLRFDETYRFREDPPTGGFLTLIGYDYEAYSVANEPERVHYKLSENYLTGERVESTATFDKKGNEIGGQPKRTAFKADKTDFSETRAKKN